MAQRSPSDSVEDSGFLSSPHRNPIERAVVWVGIAVAGLVALNEARAKYGYESTLGKVTAAIQAMEASSTEDTAGRLTIEELENLASGWPAWSHNEAVEPPVARLQWRGIKTYGLNISYGSRTRLVMDCSTDDAPPAESPMLAPIGEDPVSSDGESGASVEGGEGPRGMGFGGGGPRFDPMAADADGDGKLSREEAPGRMAEFFADIDTNGDGFLDAAELVARRALRRGGGGDRPRGDGNGEGGDGARPPRQRPEPDNAAPPSDAVPAAAASATGAPPTADQTAPPAAKSTEPDAAAKSSE